MPLTGKGTKVGSGLRRGDDGAGTRFFLVLAAVSVALLTVDVRQGQEGVLGAARFGAQTLAMPIRYLGTLAATPFEALGNVGANLTASQETLSELSAEVEDLRVENARLSESAQMTERLEALLQLRSTYSLKSTGARIIAGAADSWTSTVTIDKGSSSGIAVGMPVADAHGAIGQIMEVSASTAVVRLLSDESSGVSAMVQATRAQGQLLGSADGTLRLTLVRTDQTVEVGDVVVTSGLGGVFPKGLPLGRVASVEKVAGALYYTIVVEPLAAQDSFEEVLVITSLTEEQQASADDIAEADLQESASSAKAANTTEQGDEHATSKEGNNSSQGEG